MNKQKNLYIAVNKMVAVLGAGGVISARNESIDDVINALYAIDDGIVYTESDIDELFPPGPTTTTPTCLFCAETETRLNERILELEARVEDITEDKELWRILAGNRALELEELKDE